MLLHGREGNEGKGMDEKKGGRKQRWKVFAFSTRFLTKVYNFIL